MNILVNTMTYLDYMSILTIIGVVVFVVVAIRLLSKLDFRHTYNDRDLTSPGEPFPKWQTNYDATDSFDPMRNPYHPDHLVYDNRH